MYSRNAQTGARKEKSQERVWTNKKNVLKSRGYHCFGVIQITECWSAAHSASQVCKDVRAQQNSYHMSYINISLPIYYFYISILREFRRMGPPVCQRPGCTDLLQLRKLFHNFGR